MARQVSGGSGLGCPRCHSARRHHAHRDTLPGMGGAQRLYGILGFREIAAYYENPIPGSRYMELDLRSPT